MAHAEVGDAHDKRAVLRVAVNARLGDFREMRFYRRGHHKEYLQVAEWFGLRRREVEVEVFDDVVLFAAMRPKAEIGSKRELAPPGAAQDPARLRAAQIFPQHRQPATSRRCFPTPGW